MKFALVLNGKVIEEREYESQPACKMIGGVPVIRRLENKIPAFNEQTQRAVFSDPQYEIHDDVVYRLYQIEDKAQSELKNQQHNDALSAGYDSGFGYKLSVTQYAQGRFSALMVGIIATGMPDSQQIPIWDQEEQKHIVTVSQFKQMMAGYVVHCLSIEP